MDPQNNIPTGKCFPKINNKAIRTNSMDVCSSIVTVDFEQVLTN